MRPAPLDQPAPVLVGREVLPFPGARAWCGKCWHEMEIANAASVGRELDRLIWHCSTCGHTALTYTADGSEQGEAR